MGPFEDCKALHRLFMILKNQFDASMAASSSSTSSTSGGSGDSGSAPLVAPLVDALVMAMVPALLHLVHRDMVSTAYGLFI